MRSLTLSPESVFVRTVHLAPSSKPRRFFHYCSNFNLSHLRPSLFLSRTRFSRWQCLKANAEWSRRYFHSDYDNSLSNTGGFELYISQSPLSRRKTNLIKQACAQEDVPDSDKPFPSYLKFMFLCGLFTLQSSQPAVAGPDFASGLQSFPFLGDLGDISTGFASAFLLIFFSELGDKTFFIAALLAARNSAGVVFLGTFGALAVMTIISVVLGRTFHYVDDILPFRLGDNDLPIDDIAAVFLLVYFGVSTLLEAASDGSVKVEEEQKEAELAVSELSGNGAGILEAANTIISTFILVFVAEWGDKSFFSTIALAAASSPLGVIGGALAGHGIATLLAVLGGSLIGTSLSEKVIAYIGGTLFLIFAAVTLIEIVS